VTKDERPVIIGDEELYNVHAVEACMGEWCPIHNPSDHPLSSARLHWRGDRGIFERICEHGIGHVDPDSLAYLRRRGVDDPGIHGCCWERCCSVKK
jgi:hypothetical protein